MNDFFGENGFQWLKIQKNLWLCLPNSKVFRFLASFSVIFSANRRIHSDKFLSTAKSSSLKVTSMISEIIKYYCQKIKQFKMICLGTGTGIQSHQTVGIGTKICETVPVVRSSGTKNPDISGQEKKSRECPFLSRPLPTRCFSNFKTFTLSQICSGCFFHVILVLLWFGRKLWLQNSRHNKGSIAFWYFHSKRTEIAPRLSLPPQPLLINTF